MMNGCNRRDLALEELDVSYRKEMKQCEELRDNAQMQLRAAKRHVDEEIAKMKALTWRFPRFAHLATPFFVDASKAKEEIDMNYAKACHTLDEKEQAARAQYWKNRKNITEKHNA